MKIDQFNLKKTILGTVREDQFLYIDSQIGLQVQFLIAIVFLFLSSPPLLSRVSYIIYLHLNDLGTPLVSSPSHYLSACPIRHPHRPSVSWVNQDSTVQRSSTHKCGQRVSCRAFNVVVAVFSQIFISFHFVMYVHSVYPYQQNFLERHSG